MPTPRVIFQLRTRARRGPAIRLILAAAAACALLAAEPARESHNGKITARALTNLLAAPAFAQTSAPSAPLNPRASADRRRPAAWIAWQAPANANDATYNIQRRKPPDNNWNALAEGIGRTIHADNSVTIAGTYQYRMAAVNQNGTGPWAETPALTISAPAAPANVTIHRGGGAAEWVISWNAPESSGSGDTALYRVQRKTAADDDFADAGIAGPLTRRLTDAQLTPDRGHIYRVRAESVYGGGEWSAETPPHYLTPPAGEQGECADGMIFHQEQCVRVLPACPDGQHANAQGQCAPNANCAARGLAEVNPGKCGETIAEAALIPAPPPAGAPRRPRVEGQPGREYVISWLPPEKNGQDVLEYRVERRIAHEAGIFSGVDPADCDQQDDWLEWGADSQFNPDAFSPVTVPADETLAVRVPHLPAGAVERAGLSHCYQWRIIPINSAGEGPAALTDPIAARPASNCPAGQEMPVFHTEAVGQKCWEIHRMEAADFCLRRRANFRNKGRRFDEYQLFARDNIDDDFHLGCRLDAPVDQIEDAAEVCSPYKGNIWHRGGNRHIDFTDIICGVGRPDDNGGAEFAAEHSECKAYSAYHLLRRECRCQGLAEPLAGDENECACGVAGADDACECPAGTAYHPERNACDLPHAPERRFVVSPAEGDTDDNFELALRLAGRGDDPAGGAPAAAGSFRFFLGDSRTPLRGCSGALRTEAGGGALTGACQTRLPRGRMMLRAEYQLDGAARNAHFGRLQAMVNVSAPPDCSLGECRRATIFLPPLSGGTVRADWAGSAVGHGETVPPGVSVVFVGVPAAGRAVSGWSGWDGACDATARCESAVTANVTVRAEFSCADFHAAARSGDRAAALCNLAEGAAADAPDSSGNTPLGLAAENGRLEMAALLLARGAAVNRADAAGRTPLRRARDANREAMVRFLIMRGGHHGAACAGKNVVNPAASSPPCAACAASERPGGGFCVCEPGRVRRDGDCVGGGVTLEYSASPGGALRAKRAEDAEIESGGLVPEDAVVTLTATPDPGWTLTMWGGDCAAFGKEQAECVLTGTQNLTVSAEFGCADFHQSAQNGDLPGMECNLAEGRDVNARHSGDGRTPLHFAAFHGRLDAVTLLLGASGVSVNAEDAQMQTPLARAVTSSFLGESGDAVLRRLAMAGGHRGQACESPQAVNLRADAAVCAACRGEEVLFGGVCECAPEFTAPDGSCAALRTVRFPPPSGGTISAAADGGGALQSGDAVFSGTRVVFTATPAAGRALAFWGGHCAAQPAGQPRCVLRVTMDAEASAGFSCYDFHFAARHPRLLDGVRCNLAEGADVNRADADGKTPLHHAAENGAADTTALLTAVAAVSLNAPDSGGRSPLWLAAEAGQPETAAALIAAGADVNQANGPSGETPLARALRGRLAGSDGHAETMRLLLAAGAHYGQACVGDDQAVNPNAAAPPCISERTVFFAQTENPAGEVIGTLSAGWALNPNLSDGDVVPSGTTVTFTALLRGGKAARWTGDCLSDEAQVDGNVCALLVNRLRVNVGVVFGCVKTFVEAVNNNANDIDAVICNRAIGADVNQLDNAVLKRTPLHLAAGGSAASAALVELLATTPGVSINAQEFQGYTPLIGAIFSSRRELIPILLAAGADPNIEDKAGNRPLRLVVDDLNDPGSNDYGPEDARLLIAHGAHYGGEGCGELAVNPRSDTPPCLEDFAVSLSFSAGGALSAGWAEDDDVRSGETVPQNAVVTFTATPDAGRALTLWGGDCADVGREQAECALTARRNLTVVAEFGCADFHGAAGAAGAADGLAGVECNLDAGGAVNATNALGEAPLHSAAAAGRAPVVTVLAERGADVNLADNNGDTPLHRAAGGGRAAAAGALLFFGASVNLENDSERTPLYLAVEGGHPEAARTLLEADGHHGEVCGDGTRVNSAATEPRCAVVWAVNFGVLAGGEGGTLAAGWRENANLPNGGEVLNGAAVTFTARPRAGWGVLSWGGDCGRVPSTEVVCVVESVTTPASAEVSFADVDECARDEAGCAPPESGGMCANTAGGFMCECEKGFAGDGRFCEPDDSIKTITLLPTRNGTLFARPAAAEVERGTTVTFTATPDSGYALSVWLGDCAGASGESASWR